MIVQILAPTYIYTPYLEISITHVLEIAHSPLPPQKKYNTYARDTHPWKKKD